MSRDDGTIWKASNLGCMQLHAAGRISAWTPAGRSANFDYRRCRAGPGRTLGRSRWRSWQRRGDRSTPTINHTTHERLQASLGRPLVLPSFQRLDLTPGLVSPRRNRPSRYRPLVLCQVFFAHCVTSSLRECITLFAMQHLYWD